MPLEMGPSDAGGDNPFASLLKMRQKLPSLAKAARITGK